MNYMMCSFKDDNSSSGFHDNTQASTVAGLLEKPTETPPKPVGYNAALGGGYVSPHSASCGLDNGQGHGSPDTTCRFLKGVVDQCYASRFYARILEYYYLEADQYIGSWIACPMSQCGMLFAEVKAMISHLKTCKSLSTGEFECPSCSKKETFATISKKRCSWGEKERTGIIQWVQSNLRSSSAKRKPLSYVSHAQPSFLTGDMTTLGPNFDERRNASDLLEYGPGLVELPHTEPPSELMGCNSATAELEAIDPPSTDIISKCGQFDVFFDEIGNSFSDLHSAQAPGFFPSQHPGSLISSPSDSQGTTQSILVSPTSSTSSSGCGLNGIKHTQLSSLHRNSHFDPVDFYHSLQCGTQQSIPSVMNVNQDQPFNLDQNISGLVPTDFPYSVRPMNEGTPVSGQENIRRSLALAVKTHFPDADATPAPLALKMYASVPILDPQDVQEAQNMLDFDTESLRSPIGSDASALELPQTSISGPTEPFHSIPSCTATDIQDSDAADSIPCCLLCGYRPKGKPENYSSSMSKHKKVHEGGKVPCPECGGMFTRKDNMMQHWRRVHSKRPGSSSSSVKEMPSRKKVAIRK